ncbi:MAG: hypothetical protein ABSC42_02795 [Tepidisphaeraceae bacterium]|jgi:hypothetical protein
MGICIGLLAAGIVLATTGGRETNAISGPILSECDGRIRSIAIQYVRGADFALPVYRQFLGQLPADVTVYAVCPDRQSFEELQSRLGTESSWKASPPRRLRAVVTGHPMTAWSRDRWISLRAGRRDSTVILVASRGEDGGQIWPQRQGDQRIAEDLARVIGRRAIHSGLYFDGGDFLADSRSVFIAPGAIARNIQHTCGDEGELSEILRRQLGLCPVLLKDAPDHHAGMFMMAAGDGRVVVGDPKLANGLLTPMELPGGPDFSDSTQRRFDSVAAAATAAGYRVTRIPCVPSYDGKTYVTFVNGIIDQRDGRRTIYMPVYQGQAPLNAAAQRVWENLGYRVVPIDVTSTFRYFGTLHCLVNVIEKD